MSLKGALPKTDSTLRDEPFIMSEETKGESAANDNQTTTPNKTQAAAEATTPASAAAVTASKEPILGLESNNNSNQNKVPLKTID